MISGNEKNTASSINEEINAMKALSATADQRTEV